MNSQFTFELALGYAFTAPRPATFMAKFGASYALVSLAAFGLIGFLARDSFMDAIRFDGTDIPDAEAIAVLMPLLGWIVLVMLSGWVIWAMFEAASQRRYIWHRDFSLGLGADELRMMGTGFWWFLMSAVLFAVPMLMVLGAFLTIAGDPSDPAAEGAIVGTVFGIFGIMFVLFPLYVFFATRLAPCFGQTIKDGRVRFFDAWNISRGRFWPILGAYVILAIGAGVISQVISGIAQFLFIPALMNISEMDGPESAESVMALLTSPTVLVPFAIYMFLVLFLQGVVQHVVGAPAALAARHDPRGGVEDLARVDAFS